MTTLQKIMTQPITLIFRFLQSRGRVHIWLYENNSMIIEGRILGFDEFMNIVLDEAEEINVKTNARRSVGRLMLKGDCITLIKKAE